MRKHSGQCGGGAILAALVLLVSLAQGAPGPATTPAQSETALGRQEARVREMMDSLEQTFLRLSETIRANEPEKADKLIKAMQAAKEKLLQTRMAVVVKLLNEERFDDANKEQKKIVEDLQALLLILTQDDADKLRREEELRLEAFRAQLERLIKEESQHIAESDKAADPDKAIADLAARIKALEDLIKAQAAARDQNIKDRAAGPQALGKAADMQHDVSKATIDLARKLSGQGSADKPPGGDQAGKPEGDQAAKPGGDQAGKPGGDQAGKPGGDQAGKPEGDQAAKPGGDQAGKPGGDQAGKPGGDQAGKPEGDQAAPQSSPPQPGNGPGEQAVARAIADQHKAEDALGNGKGPTAEKHQDEAIKELKEAKAALEKERDRIARLPPDNADKLAKAQNETTGRTSDLAKEMAKPTPGSSTQPSNPDDPNSPPPTPGQQNVDEASQQMGKSEGDLKGQKPGDASKKQQEARKQLQKAKEEIEKRLAQLRKEMQEQRLADLENRFRAILERQRPVTRETVRLDRVPRSGWSRPEAISCDTQANEERALGELTQQALTIIAEDGTTVVFPRVVEGLRDDFTSAQMLLKDHSTNQYTQEIQKQIEQTLHELIDALKKAQEQAKNDQSGESEDGSEPPPQPLVPDSAELKLLRAAQLRVNTRTIVFDQVRPPAGAPLDAVKANEIRRLADLQRSVQNMTEEMAQKKP